MEDKLGHEWITQPTCKVAQSAASKDRLALDRVAGLLDGREWNADTLADIAEAVRDTGRKVEDLP